MPSGGRRNIPERRKEVEADLGKLGTVRELVPLSINRTDLTKVMHLQWTKSQSNKLYALSLDILKYPVFMQGYHALYEDILHGIWENSSIEKMWYTFEKSKKGKLHVHAWLYSRKIVPIKELNKKIRNVHFFFEKKPDGIARTNWIKYMLKDSPSSIGCWIKQYNKETKKYDIRKKIYAINNNQ